MAGVGEGSAVLLGEGLLMSVVPVSSALVGFQHRVGLGSGPGVWAGVESVGARKHSGVGAGSKPACAEPHRGAGGLPAATLSLPVRLWVYTREHVYPSQCQETVDYSPVHIYTHMLLTPYTHRHTQYTKPAYTTKPTYTYCTQNSIPALTQVRVHGQVTS